MVSIFTKSFHDEQIIFILLPLVFNLVTSELFLHMSVKAFAVGGGR